MQRTDNYWIRRRLSRRKFVSGSAGAMVGAAALGTVGCGGDDDDDDSGDGNGGGGGTTPGAQPTSAPSGARGEPTGDLRASVASLMDQSADPFYQTGGLAQPISLHLFNSFFRGDDEGQREVDLAESFEITPDRMQIIFKMRQDVKFWDGTTMTANDSVWSYEAFIGREPPNPFVATLGRTVERVDSPDENTVVLHLKVPTPFQGQELILWPTSSQAYYERVGEDEFRNNSMGTGPFKLVRNEIGAAMEFEAFPDHFRKDRVPFVKTVRLNIVPELTTRLAQLRAGEIDLTEGVTGPTAESLKSESGIKIITAPETAQLKAAFVEVGNNVSPWNDIRFREAMVKSVNQEDIVTGLLKQGKPSPHVQIWPKMKGYDESLFPYAGYDPDRARQLISESGQDGFSFNVYTYTSSSYPLIPEVTQAFVGFWKEIGLNPSITQHEAGGHFTQYTSRSLDGVAFISFPFQPDLRLLIFNYLKTGANYGSTDNFTEIDSGIDRMVAAESEEEQFEIAQEIYKYVYGEYLMGTAPWSDSQWAATEKVKNWIRPAGQPYMVRLESLELDA